MSESEALAAISVVAYLTSQGAVCVRRLRELGDIRKHSSPESGRSLISRYDAVRRRRLNPIVYIFNLPGRSLAYLIDGARNRY